MTLAPPLTLHGIPNCDTVKQARAWLDDHGVTYAFHDYKKAGIDAATLGNWAGQVGWEVLLNRAGTTFKKLPDTDRANLDEGKAIALMVAQPSMIKRPVVTGTGELLVGFKPDHWAETLC
jgi:arsenate reductase (glutaredoxin)